MRDFCIGVFLLCAASGALGQTIYEKAEKDLTVNMRREEPAMRNAMEKARLTLDEFLLKAKKPAPGTDAYAVKVGIPQGNDTEYFWINDFAVSGQRFTGAINNQPEIVTSVKLGQRYSFDRGQIVDWVYVDVKKHKMYGNFTACALLTKEPASEAEELKRHYGLDCS